MTDFDVLLSTVKDLLKAEAVSKNTQAICLQSAKGELYHLTLKNALDAETEVADFMEMLRASEDTHIARLVCMWQSGCVDLPSFAFRKNLFALDPQNRDCLILLQGAQGLNTRTLEASF